MAQNLALIALVVADYDEAIKFYTEKLNFTLVEDTIMSETKRWVVVAPPGSTGCNILLAKAANNEQQTRVGNQTGGRVFLFLHTDDFWNDYNRMKAEGVTFAREAVEEAWGTVAVFQDLYGKLWDFIQPKSNV
jgi:catechol 2,3-dioxygenase-like lactoylglutathione lyase family enzyme